MKKTSKRSVSMKKVIIIMIALLTVLSCVGITACSSGKEDVAPTQTQSQQQKTTGVASTTTQSQSTISSSGISAGWGDMPIYSGAQENIKVSSDKNETVNSKPAIYESRMYTTSDKRDKVVAFYKDKMPANGWKETSWTKTEVGDKGSSLGQYDKNGGDSLAVLQISDTDKGTLIKLDKKYPR
jgi:hypothetical protein